MFWAFFIYSYPNSPSLLYSACALLAIALDSESCAAFFVSMGVRLFSTGDCASRFTSISRSKMLQIRVKLTRIERYRLFVHTCTSYSRIARILLIYATKHSVRLMTVKCHDVLTTIF